MKTRVAAERRGRLAESAAALYLTMKGYRILDRRFRSPLGEIDLIVWNRQPAPGGTVCFVEVKWRPTLDGAVEAIRTGQRERLARAATAFLARRRDLTQAEVRFDILVLAPSSWPRHLRDAWRP